MANEQKGSLNYEITQSGSGPADLVAFRNTLREVREEFDRLKESFRETVSLAGVARQTEALHKAALNQQKASQKAARTSSIAQQIDKSRLALQNQINTATFVASRSDISALRQRLAILKKIQKVEDLIAIGAKLREQGRDPTSGALASERAKLELMRAQAEAEFQILRRKDEELKKTQALAEAQKRLANLEVRRQAAALTAAEGIDFKSGRTTAEIEAEKLAKQKAAEDRKREQERKKAETDAARAAKERAKQSALAAKALKDEDTAANRLLFTFRRLFGVLFLFTLTRRLFRGFTDAIKDALELNKAVESAILGIGTLFTAVGNVRDALGQTVDPARQLDVALGEARRQVDLLRRDALRTAAPFTDLLQTFQVAIAPGLEAGLSPDQIRNFAIRISQAAQAIGLAQSQLAEEIRSILQGTIQARTTRIAVALGISNEDIRRAREAGKLGEFLAERFKAFEVAASRALQTFGVIVQRASAAIAQLVQQGSLDFVEQLRIELTRVFQLLVRFQGIEEIPIINPQALGIIRRIFQTLTLAVKQLASFGQAFRFEEIAGVVDIIATQANLLFQLFGELTVPFVKGLNLALAIVSSIVNLLTNVFTKITAALGPLATAFGTSAADLLSMLVAAKALQIIFKGYSGILRGVTGIVTNLVRNFRTLGFAIQRTMAGTIAWRATLASAFGSAVRFAALAFLGVLGAVSATMSAITGKTVSWTQALEIVKEFFIFLGTVGINTLKLIASFIVKIIGDLGGKLADLILKTAAALNVLNLGALDALGLKGFIDGLTEAAVAVDELAFKLKNLDKDTVGRFTITFKDFIQQFSNAVTRLGLQTVRIISDQKLQDAGLFDFLIKTLPKALSPVGEVLLKLNDAIDETFDIARARDFSTIFEELPGIISATIKPLEKDEELIKSIQEKTAELARELETVSESADLSQPLQAAVERITRITSEFDEKRRALLIQNEQIAKQRLETEQALLVATDRKIKLGVKEAATIDEGIDKIQEKLGYEKEISKNTVEKLELQNRLKDVTKVTTDEELKGIQARIKLIDEENALAQERIDNILEGTKDLLKVSTVPKEARDLILQIVALEGQKQALTEQGNESQEQLNRLLTEEKNLRGKVAEIVRREQFAPLEKEIRGLKNLIAARQELNAVALLPDEDRRRAAAELRAQRIEIQGQIDELSRLQGATKDFIIDQNLAFEEGVIGQEELSEKTKLANKDIEKQRFEFRALFIDMKAVTDLLERERLRKDEPIAQGFKEGLTDIHTRFTDLFRQVNDIATQGAEALRDTLVDSITSAFDPENTQSAEEAFKDFLKRLGQLILSAGIEQLIANVFLGAFKAAPTGAVPLSPFDIGLTAAAHKGGRVGRGYSRGGDIERKPFHRIHPKDTENIWAQIGEWIHPVDAVQYYGKRVMSAIQRRMIDPAALRALAGNAGYHHRQRSAPSYATGGIIQRIPSSTTVSGGELQVLPVMLAGERELDRMLGSGPRAFMAAIRKHSSEIKQVLKVGR